MKKTKIAEEVVTRMDKQTPWQHDFREWIQRLSDAIYAANNDRRPPTAIAKNG